MYEHVQYTYIIIYIYIYIYLNTFVLEGPRLKPEALGVKPETVVNKQKQLE